MDIKELFNIQQQLDNKILTEHKLQGRDLINEKILALQVELGELANETRCFKYWSKKAPSELEVILEEYVDCLHFILSIGLEKEYFQISIRDNIANKSNTDIFIDVFEGISTFRLNQTLENYLLIWEYFILLSNSLGFTWQEITDAYLKKNEINHQRQAQGY